MAESQAVALVFIVVIAYYLVSYWRKLIAFLAVVLLSVFGFGIFTLAQIVKGDDPPTDGDQVVKTETTTHPR
ncbi:hypothetical protein [Kribbella sp. NPDC003557]|uniref:hypothetical protein n=1 Tax=Kribbella sp. NPDC003557 TaxID=3154449 RepID=UPI0033A16AF0